MKNEMIKFDEKVNLETFIPFTIMTVKLPSFDAAYEFNAFDEMANSVLDDIQSYKKAF